MTLITSDIQITEETYSQDNYAQHLCVLEDGSLWVTWAEFGPVGSRVFGRQVVNGQAGPIQALAETADMQTQPRCFSRRTGGALTIWFQKNGQTYSIHGRAFSEGKLGESQLLFSLPEGAKPGELEGTTDADGQIWLAWAQAARGRSTIEVVCIPTGGEARHFELDAGVPFNYRPALCEVDGGVALVWDAYVGKSYDVFGCSVEHQGPSGVRRISSDECWENRPNVCCDSAGRLWAAWVHHRDVMFQDSIIQSKCAVRGALYENAEWVPLAGADGSQEIVPLHYGLLTDLKVHPQLGHQGHRLKPMLKASKDGGIWLFYESKAEEADNTIISKGRLLGLHHSGSSWSSPLDIAEGRVEYTLASEETVCDSLLHLSRDIDNDRLFLSETSLVSSMNQVPDDKRTVDLTHWKEIQLPFPSPKERPKNELPGEESGKYQLFWADLHCHSSMSIEMEGDPDELAFYARDRSLLDGLTVSDNDQFWNKFTRNSQRYLKDHEWDMVKGNALVTNEPGRFAMFPGYEMTIGGNTDEERNHRSVMSDDNEMEMDLLHFKEEHYVPHRHGDAAINKDVVECIAWAGERSYLPHPHPHNGTYGLTDENVEWNVDIYAGWMRNIELYDIFFKYLDAGHKIGFTASGDSHYRNPGFNCGVTGIWSEGLGRASFLEALRAHRCYGTAGQRIVIEFTINDQMMGSSLVVQDDPVLRWRVLGEDQDYILRIHRDGRLMFDERFRGETRGEYAEFRFLEYRPGRHYYLLEVSSPEPVPDYPSNVAHALGARAWSSPIWVETPVPSG